MRIIKRIFKFLFILLGGILLILLVALGIDSYKTSYLKVANNEFADNDSYLITHVNIIPMDQDTVLTNKMVLIKDGKIHTIANRIQGDSIEVIDARDKFLVPGLIDMHVHVWDRYELGLYLSNGVTAVRNLWGMPMHLRIKEDVVNDKIISPLFYTTGPKLTGPEFIGDDNLNLTSPEEAREKVVSYKKRGYDFIKTYYGLTEDIFDAIIEQSRISEMDIISHPSPKVPYEYHFNPQIKSIEHIEDIIQQPLNYNLDTTKLEEVINDFKNLNQGAFSPTLTGYYNIYQMLTDDEILESKQLDYMNPLIKMTDSKAQFDRWYDTKLRDPNTVKSIKDQHDFHLYILNKMYKADVPIVCSTDSGIGITIPGLSIHQELAFYKEAGLSNYEVLRTATVNASETHAIMNNLGSIQEGKIANLLLLDKNPLEDLASLKTPSTVFVKGRKLNRATLDTFEEKAAQRSNLLASAIRYAENLYVEK